MSRYQKGKTSLDFTEARDSEWQWHQLGHMQVCTSLQTDNHASSPPLSFLQAGCPSCRQTNSVKALKATHRHVESCCLVVTLLCAILRVPQTVQDCVLYYYLSKMSANYKQLVRRHLSKRRTKPQKVGLLTYCILILSLHRWLELLLFDYFNTTVTDSTVLQPLYKSTCVNRHLQLRTGWFCWCKVLLPECSCWRQPAHSD